MVLGHLQNRLSVKTPALQHTGEIESWPYIVMSLLEGTSLEHLWEGIPFENKVILIRELGKLIREVHSISPKGLEAIDCQWEAFLDGQVKACVDRHRGFKLPEALLVEIPEQVRIKNWKDQAKSLKI